MATGLACLELYKLAQEIPQPGDGGTGEAGAAAGAEIGDFAAERYKNAFLNLALPLMALSEPAPPKRVQHRPECGAAWGQWSVWDRWGYDESRTLQQLLHWLAVRARPAPLPQTSPPCHRPPVLEGWR